MILLVLFTLGYLIMVLFTGISLTGYWTDVIFSIFLVSITLRIVFKGRIKNLYLKILLRTIAILYATVVYGLFVLNLINPFSWDILKLRSFIYVKVNGRLFNAYFKPVGAYGGGEGSFWITESPVYFPLIEILKYYDRTVSWDFSARKWQGKPINQKEVVKKYILDKIITTKK